MAVIERETYSPEAVQDSLEPILDAVRSVYEPERIVLYGSAAEGRPWHDLDLVVIAETDDRFIDRQMKLAKALSGVRHVPADIFVYTPQELRQQIEQNRFFIVREVLGKGRSVYQKGRGAAATGPRKAVAPPVEEYRRQGVRPVTEEMAADTRSWLNQAQDDRRWASYNLDGGFYPQACFASQQCAEKLLKAYLLSSGRVPPRIHELPALLAQCAEVEAGLRRLEPQAALLDRYYIATRYPHAWLPGGPYGEDDARSAIDAATQFFEALQRPILEWLKGRE